MSFLRQFVGPTLKSHIVNIQSKHCILQRAGAAQNINVLDALLQILNSPGNYRHDRITKFEFKPDQHNKVANVYQTVLSQVSVFFF